MDIKTELYSILRTTEFLKKNFDNGSVDPNFFFKKIKFFHGELLSLQQDLNQFNMSLLEIVEDLKIPGNFKSMLSVISGAQDAKFNKIAHQWQIDPFELAAIATETTSNFITLLDYLHLIDSFEIEFLMRLISDLKKGLGSLSTFQPFFEEISELEEQLPQFFEEENINSQTEYPIIKDLMTQIEDYIYNIFKKFKNYLNIK